MPRIYVDPEGMWSSLGAGGSDYVAFGPLGLTRDGELVFRRTTVASAHSAGLRGR